MDKENLQNEIITIYRTLLAERYNFKHLKEKYELPKSFDEDRINQIKDYFLDYIYPSPMKRKELDTAFHNLDNYIKHPEKLIRLLLDSARLLFKYGRHLPKILRAGLKALSSFRTANNFEERLIQQAQNSNLKPPFNESDIKMLLSAIPKEEIESFIAGSQSLFNTLHDRVLIKKIIEIVEYLIKKMKSRPDHYSTDEIKGLEIGRDIVKYGNLLFDQLSKEEQGIVFDFIIMVEKDFLGFEN